MACREIARTIDWTKNVFKVWIPAFAKVFAKMLAHCPKLRFTFIISTVGYSILHPTRIMFPFSSILYVHNMGGIKNMFFWSSEMPNEASILKHDAERQKSWKENTKADRYKWEIMFPFFRSTDKAPKDKSSKSRSRGGSKGSRKRNTTTSRKRSTSTI